MNLINEYYLDGDTIDATTLKPVGNVNVSASYSNGSQAFSYLTGGNASGLVGFWKFNNESRFGENSTHVFDFSYNGNNGTCTASACPVVNVGKYGNSYKYENSRCSNGREN